MVLEFLRFVRGYVAFTVSGRFPERFINITARNGVHIWNVERRGELFAADMYMSDYLRVRALARRAEVRLKITRRAGLPDILSRYRGRVGVAVGACAFVLTVFVMSLFIWSVDVTGLETVSMSEMRSLLREHGMYVGAFKPALDYRDIAREIMIEKKSIGWMAVNVTGSCASVEVKEESPKPEVTDIYSPCNVKAARDGRILSMDTFQGSAVIGEGSGVVEGQLLVSGVMTDEMGGQRLVHSDARVIAQTVGYAEFDIDEDFTVLKPDTETARRGRVRLFGLSVPYVFESVSSPYSVCDRYAESPAPLGVSLPVGVETELVSALRPRSVRLSDDSAEGILIMQSQLYEAFALSKCRVIGRDYLLRHEDGKYKLDVTYTCVEDIACSDPIGVDESAVLSGRPSVSDKKE